MAMTTQDLEIKDGDIFRWEYAEPGSDSHDRYWCKSRIAVARNGYLRDTFWGSLSSESVKWTYADAEKLLVLEPVANFADLEPADEWEKDYYDDADCVNLNHANSSRGNFYIRKGAQRSAAKMLEVAEYKREKARRDSEYAAREAGRYSDIIASIQSGADLASVHV